MAGPGDGYDRGDAGTEVLVTIHGRVFNGTLHRGARMREYDEWRWYVEIHVDDRRVMTWVAADQVEFVDRRGCDGV